MSSCKYFLMQKHRSLRLADGLGPWLSNILLTLSSNYRQMHQLAGRVYGFHYFNLPSVEFDNCVIDLRRFHNIWKRILLEHFPR